MPLTIDAVYENGVLKLVQPLPLKEHEKVRVTLHTTADREAAVAPVRRSQGSVPWTGSLEDLDYLIDEDENDPLEAP